MAYFSLITAFSSSSWLTFSCFYFFSNERRQNFYLSWHFELVESPDDGEELEAFLWHQNKQNY